MVAIKERIDKLPVSEDTKHLLRELSKRKSKVDGLKLGRFLLSMINLGIAAIVMIWLSKMSAMSSASVFELAGYLGKSQASLIFLGVAVTLFIYAGAVGKEYKKQKEKYDNLRREAIDRLSARWEISDESMLRDEISEMLKKDNGANIRYWS